MNPGEILVNGTKITGFDGRALDVTNPVDHSEAEQFSIYQAKEFFKFLKEEIPGLPTHILLIMRRRLEFDKPARF